jgi:hypothetical protein
MLVFCTKSLAIMKFTTALKRSHPFVTLGNTVETATSTPLDREAETNALSINSFR